MVLIETRARRFTVPWAGDSRSIEVPAGHPTMEITFTNLPPLADPAAALRHAMDHPTASPPLRALVRPGNRVALLTGDRITDYMLGSRDGLGHVILDYLNAAGVPDSDITLVFAPGTHAHRNIDEKLGPALIGRVGRYVRHRADVDEDLTFIGYTPRGNALWVNRAVTEADVVVGFGEISPNTHGGWTGGGKMILPGVAGQASIEHNHRQLMLPSIPLGLADGNPLRRDMEDAAALLGLDFKIDVLVDEHARMVDIVAGDFVAAHRAALPRARQIWMTPVEPADICLFHPADWRDRTLEGSMFISINGADLATKDDGVIIACVAAVNGYSDGPGMPYSAMMSSRDALKLRAEELARSMIQGHGNARTGSIHFATRHVLDRKKVYLVTEGIDAGEAREFGFSGVYADPQSALNAAMEEKGNRSSIVVNTPCGLCWRQMPWREG